MAKYNAYLEAKAEYDNYTAWYQYFSGTVAAENDIRTMGFNAAKNNTVIKTASFDTADGTRFTAAAKVSVPGASVYMPTGTGDAVFYAKAGHYTDEEIKAKSAAYIDHLNSVYNATGDAQSAMTEYGYQTALAQWQINGKYSELHARIDDQDVGVKLANEDESISMVLENISVLQKSNDCYYVAYSTGQDVQDSATGDYVHIHRLYLRALSNGDDGKWTWQDARLLRTVMDYDKNDSLDGVYQGGAIKTDGYENPYFANFQFLNGKIGDKLTGGETVNLRTRDNPTAEDFLLFEMNGATYIIRSDSLDSLLSDNLTCLIYPFFNV